MAAQSMTGYGKAETVGEGYSVTVELKSVNNRFLEFQVRASKNILPLEPRLKQELGKHLARGSVNCRRSKSGGLHAPGGRPASIASAWRAASSCWRTGGSNVMSRAS